MEISKQTAQKLVRWNKVLGCNCDTNTRLERVLGTLGGGVDAAVVRNRPMLEMREKEAVPSRISEVIQRVFLERSMSCAETAVSIFKNSGKTFSFCSCSDSRGNASVSILTAWEVKPGDVDVTCPFCTSKYRASPSVTSQPLIQMLLRDVISSDSLLEKLYALLIGATGGCGRNSEARFSSFNGSWTCLVYNTERRTIDAEFLISNVVSTSCRLQPVCMCNEILYMISGLINTNDKLKFAFKATEIKILGGGEFLYMRYPVFRQGGVFDRVPQKALRNIVKSEPCGVSGAGYMEPTGKGESAIADTTSSTTGTPDAIIPNKKRQRKKQMENVEDNVVNIQHLMSIILTNGKRSVSSEKRKRNTVATVQEDSSSDDPELTLAPPEDSIFILPTPQVEEQCISNYRKSNQSIPTERVKVIHSSGDKHVLDIKRIFENSRVVCPVSNTIISPPLVIREHFNSYKVLSGLLMYFDRIEEEFTANEFTNLLDDNAAVSVTFKLLSLIRENSLRRGIEVLSEEGDSYGIHVSRKTLPARNNVVLSHKDVDKGEVCTETILNILGGLVK